MKKRNKVRTQDELQEFYGEFNKKGAKVKFDARVAILGNIHKNGLGVQGVTMPGFQNSCPTSSPSGDYQCVFPSGWSGTLAPSLTGSSFNPANRSYSNVQYLGGMHH